MPDELETKIYDFSITDYPGLYNIEKVSLAPMLGSSTGIIVSEPESALKKDSEGKRILYPPQDNSMVSWWKFDGNARDSVGGNDGILEGNIEIENGELVLGAGKSFVNISLFESKIPTEKISISIWAKPQPIGNYDLFSLEPIGNDRVTVHLPWLDENIGYQIIWQFGNPTTSSVSVDYNNGWTNIWDHFVFTADENERILKIYVNGVEIGRREGASSFFSGTSERDWLIGGRPGSSFEGRIDNVMVFNKVLSDKEILAIYNNQKKE